MLKRLGPLALMILFLLLAACQANAPRVPGATITMAQPASTRLEVTAETTILPQLGATKTAEANLKALAVTSQEPVNGKPKGPPIPTEPATLASTPVQSEATTRTPLPTEIATLEPIATPWSTSAGEPRVDFISTVNPKDGSKTWSARVSDRNGGTIVVPLTQQPPLGTTDIIYQNVDGKDIPFAVDKSGNSLASMPGSEWVLPTAPESVNIHKVVNFDGLAEEQVNTVFDQVIGVINKFKQGTICDKQSIKDFGFRSRSGFPYLGVMAASAPNGTAHLQVCVLASLTKGDDMFVVAGYQTRGGALQAAILRLPMQHLINFQGDGGGFVVTPLPGPIYKFEGTVRGQRLRTKTDVVGFWADHIDRPVVLMLQSTTFTIASSVNNTIPTVDPSFLGQVNRAAPLTLDLAISALIPPNTGDSSLEGFLQLHPGAQPIIVNTSKNLRDALASDIPMFYSVYARGPN